MAANGQKTGKLIALTFDDGPGPYTNRLLDGLAERGVHVTFFMLGSRAENYSKTVRRVYAEGHQIASHSYDHPQLSAKTDEQIRWQVGRTKDILNGHLEKDFTYLVRPPYGDYNSRVLTNLDAPAIFWSVDPLDWKYRDADTVCENIVDSASDGAIVLAHDIHSTTVDGALRAIDILQEKGYEFVTVNELFRRRGETLENGLRYYSCKGSDSDLGPVSEPEIERVQVYGASRIRLTADEGADIYYTTDGSDPAFSGTRYTGEFELKQEQTLKACAAFDLNGSRSKTITTKLSALVQAPEVSVQNGKIVLKNPNASGDVRYTTDGSTPTANSSVYTAPIDCFDGTLRFCTMADGGSSAVKTIYVTKNGNLFWDVPITAWFFREADRAVSLGIFRGVAQYEFAPELGLTRAMFVTTLYRLMQQRGADVSTDGTAGFRDVAAGEWYSDAVAWAAEKQFVLGYEDGCFRPDRTITREEMCVILERLTAALHITPEGEPHRFADEARISDWALSSVHAMAACGLIRGQENNRFAPQSTTTRAEAATVLLRLNDLLAEA